MEHFINASSGISFAPGELEVRAPLGVKRSQQVVSGNDQWSVSSGQGWTEVVTRAVTWSVVNWHVPCLRTKLNPKPSSRSQNGDISRSVLLCHLC